MVLFVMLERDIGWPSKSVPKQSFLHTQEYPKVVEKIMTFCSNNSPESQNKIVQKSLEVNVKKVIPEVKSRPHMHIEGKAQCKKSFLNTQLNNVCFK